MAGINGMGLTFTLPNFNGTLYGLTPEDTPFTSAIGALSGGGEPIHAKDFEWQAYDLRSPEIPANLEGQNAPTARERVRASIDNVAQIFHSQVSLSYTKQAAIGQRNGLNNVQPTAQADEMGWQVTQELKALKRDIEQTFINGVYAKPSDNTAARKTRGLLQATSTNVVDIKGAGVSFTAAAATDLVTATGHGLIAGTPILVSGLAGGTPLVNATTYYVTAPVTTNTFKVSLTQGGAAIDITVDATAGTYNAYQVVTSKTILDLMQMVWDNGGIAESETATLMCNSGPKRQLTQAFVTAKGYVEKTRTVGGVHVNTIETDFGTVNLMMNRFMPQDTIEVVSLEMCKPRVLLIPGKGFLFLEPLAKVGASDQAQLYGEIGLEYGNEKAHGKLTGINNALQV